MRRELAGYEWTAHQADAAEVLVACRCSPGCSAESSDQFGGLAQHRAQGFAGFDRLFGVAPMLERIGVADRRAGALRAPVHPTPPLALNRRRLSSRA
jgi:hypothetical protein